MKPKVTAWKAKLSAHKYFLRNFLLIFAAMAMLFSLYALYTYKNSRKIIEDEFRNASLQELKNISEYMDNFIMDTRYMISTLAINESLQLFYTSQSPELLFENYSQRVQEQLMALQYSNEAIEAIYLYSDASQTIYAADQYTPFDSFEDRSWFDLLNPDDSGFSIFPYAMHGRFPYVLCVAKELTVNGHRSVIAILVNPSKLPILKKIGENHYQETYLVSDEGELIYRYRQKELLEPLDTSDYLVNYEPDAPQKTAISPETNDAYSFTQLHSSDYPWTYVLVTHLQDYTSRLSASRAVLISLTFAFVLFAIFFAIFFSLRSLKPIRDIRKFLDNPELLPADNTARDSEIRYIAGRITQYIQTNKQLADELNKRLHLLNETQMQALQAQINPHFLFNTLNMMHILATDSLGYDHALPQMTLNLSALLRYALEPAEMVTLEKELTYTGIYLSILNQRYGETLNIIQQIAPDTLSAQVPKLFIQPIIENAVFHGFSRKHDAECILTIACSKSSSSNNDCTTQFIILKISDNGIGINEKKLEQLHDILSDKKTPSGKSIGLRNVMQRMNLTYSEQCTLSIESIPGKGSCFIMTFPYVDSQ